MKLRTLIEPVIVLSLLLCFGTFAPALAQDEVGSKGIKAEEFISNRPAKPAVRKTNPIRKPTYKTAQAAPPVAPPPGKEFAQVGLTLWRFRPTTATDKTKELVEEDGDAPPSQWSLERIEEGTMLSPGQRVRLSVESLSRNGYLYVINREEYADGSLGDARLIFPTGRTPEGGNRVKAGKMIYIPGPPRYFRIKPSLSTKGHVAEVLTVIVSAEPLIDASKLTTTAITLTPQQVEAWEKQWSTVPTKFEMEGGAGQTMTEKEQAAVSTTAEVLTQDDPLPQTIYRLAVKPNDVLLVRLPLRFTPPAKP
ncbi:MAG: hypothetical protein ABJB97_09810 [Acidobacteriota bacterium]